MSVEFRSKPHQLRRQLKEVLHTFRASGTDNPDYTPVEIDTTPFEHDGILYIEIQVGRGDAAGTFELFDSDTDLATNRSPDEALLERGMFRLEEPDTFFTVSNEGSSLNWRIQVWTARLVARTLFMRTFTLYKKDKNPKEKRKRFFGPQRRVVSLYNFRLTKDFCHYFFAFSI